MAGKQHKAKDSEPLSSGPLYKTLLAALVLHAALLSLARFAPKPALENAGLLEEKKGDWFDIETLPEPPKVKVPEAPPAEAPEPQGADKAKSIELPKSAPIPQRGGPISSDSQEPPPAGNPNELKGAGSEAPGSSQLPEDSFSPPEGAPGNGGGQGIITGLGGSPVWMVPGVLPSAPAPAPAPTKAPESTPTDSNIAGQVLSGALRKHDRELGLESPAGGVVASTITSLVRNSEAPPDARATFEIKLGPSGNVLGVRVVSSSAGNNATWQNIAKKAAADLKTKALGMLGDAATSGATVTVKIESKVVYPAGSREKIDVQPVCAEEVVQEMIRTISEGTAGEPSRGPINDPAVNPPNPAAGLANSPEEEERKRKFCIPIGIKGSGDISNLGAHTQKVVRSTFKIDIAGQKMLEDVKEVDRRAPWSPADPNKVKPIRQKWKKKKKKPSN